MKRENPLVRVLGEIFFPQDAPWQRRKKLRLILLALLAGVLIGLIIGALLLLQNFSFRR
jgi:hypothetical protein